MAVLFAGDAPRAPRSLEHGLRLNCYDPQNFVWYTVLALAFLIGKAADALQRAIATLKVRPAWRAAMRAAAAANSALGCGDEAASWLQQWSLTPATSADAVQPLWRCNPQWAETIGRLLPEAR